MEETITYVATCLFGLEHSLGEEIDSLGYKRLETMDGRVTFEGDISAVARCNIWLRTAEHLYIKVGQTNARTFDELFEGTKAMSWDRWIGPNDAFPVKGHSIKSKLTSIPDCQSIIKKALCVNLGEEYGYNILPEDGVKHQIEFFIFKDVASLMIDTSGAPLYKRGYRIHTGEAPIRETLACALVKEARLKEDVLLWDVMAGSGTIAIEAGLLMNNIAPGLKRSFDAELFDDIPEKIFSDAREEAMSQRKDSPFEAYASDIDPEMVAIAKENIISAGLEGKIKSFEMDARNIKRTSVRRVTIVTNPPYGERLMDRDSSRKLYSEIGNAFSSLGRWQIYILTSDEEFQRWYGKRADRVKRFYNGMIKCGLYEYYKNF